MSTQEVDRITVIKQVLEKRLKQKDAAKLLNLSNRQIIRLVKRYKKDGLSGLISLRRGKPSNNKHDNVVKEKVKDLLHLHYSDFGPTFAAEKLKERDQIMISKETLRQWMLEWGLWSAKRHKRNKLHLTRKPRSRFGELIQIDGSHHDWFEGRAEQCCLLVFIDDATKRLVGLRFEKEETTLGYFRLAREYIGHYGRPLAFYSDKYSVFRFNSISQVNAETQWGRAMRELNIETICANSPQAKGRVERANRTLQDRLIKEMRLRKISSIEDANNYLSEFIESWNNSFAVEPLDKQDAHRKELPDTETLRSIFSVQSTRKLSKNLEIRYENVIYQMKENDPRYKLRYGFVTVCQESSGEIMFLHKGRSLSYTRFGTRSRTPVVVSPKELEQRIHETKEPKDKSIAWRRYIAS